MSVKTKVRIDPRDLSEVEALATQAKAFVEAATAAEPAIERLYGVGYPGADFILSQFTFGAMRDVQRAFHFFAVAKGDQAALDFHRLCLADGMTVNEAAEELLQATGTEADLDRIEALRRYAAEFRP